MRLGVLVGGPPCGAVPPILDDVGLGELLTLTVAKSTLCLAGGHQIRLRQIDFQPLANVVLDGRSGAPRTTTFFHSNPEPNRYQSIHSSPVFINYFIFFFNVLIKFENLAWPSRCLCISLQPTWIAHFGLLPKECHPVY